MGPGVVVYEPQGFAPYFTVLVAIGVLLLWFLGSVGAAIAVALYSRSRARESAASGQEAPADSARLIVISVLYGAAVVGILLGIAVGNVTAPFDACPSVFQWNALPPYQQSLLSAFDGGGCTGHVARMTVAMVMAFLLAAVAALVATVLAVARLTPQGSSSRLLPPGWHPIAGEPGRLRWWDGAAWTDHYHDQNGYQR